MIFRLSTTLLVLALWACSSSTVDDYRENRLAYTQAGNGPATVILEAGLGSGMATWSLVFDSIASIATVFSYDRPGYGRSPRVTGRVRTGAESVELLRSLLRQRELKAPYVLVGHSLGGLYMQLFARLYPEEVAGIVLIDSTSAGTLAVPTPNELSLVAQREYNGVEETVNQVLQAPKFPDVPLVVLTAGQVAGSMRVKELHLQNQRGLSRLSINSRHMVLESSGHLIHRDEPQAVLEAVEYVVEQM